MAEPVIPAQLALQWADDLALKRPPQPTLAEAANAIAVLSFNTSATGRGLVLRLSTAQGRSLLFLNAAVAVQLADIIRQAGSTAGWMDPKDGSLVIRDPQNATHPGRKT